MSSVFGTGRSVNLMRYLFMSEHLWVNLSSRSMLYQLSYLMLIERSIDANLIVYVDLIVNQAEGKISAQPHTTLCIQFLDRENNDKNSRLPLGKHICFAIVWGCAEILPFFHVSLCYLHYTVMLTLKNYQIKIHLSLTVVKEFVNVYER